MSLKTGQPRSQRRPSAFRILNVETTPAVKIKSRRVPIIIGAVLTAVLIVALGIVALASSYAPLRMALSGPVGNNPPIAVKQPAHMPLPAEVRGVYVTASTASSVKNYVALLDSVKAKGINAVVLDVKDEDGALAFEPFDPGLKSQAPIRSLVDLDRVIGATHDAGFYLIARIPVFEDPAFAEKTPKLALKQKSGGLWRNARGRAWLDPASDDVWKYNVDIAREIYGRGFDEVQLDYVRFATDGKTSNIVFPIYDAKKENKRAVIGRFFAYMDNELRGGGIPISVDVFGFTTWHQNDLGIGQWYADALVSFDFVSPMVYPSHYPSGTLKFSNPAEHPYEIVLDSMEKGNDVIAELAADPAKPKVGSQRPWIQAFNMGAVYKSDKVMAQVRAARETGCSGFLFWNAGNNYSSLPDLRP